MGITKRWFILSIIGLMGLTGCVYESLTYRTVTDGVDKKEYIVVGKVTDSGNRPIENCRVFLSKVKPDMEPIPVGVTDRGGNYNLVFELEGATEFWLHFDARDQGYPIRYENFSHLLESSLFQYTGNNPVIVNVVIDKKPLVQQTVNEPDQPKD
ncbi:MAG: hypothetical protein SRB2_02557 [Desulfobacteraceae bacterium Eth-SRB2]|nr:MAG: hypothetical protein SRB2_02557 [Desulfobacteraceae bacterium Eth-SRB2]